MYKCRHSYCIPLHMVCDDVEDCPDGGDEKGCSVPTKVYGLLKCRNDNVSLQRATTLL